VARDDVSSICGDDVAVLTGRTTCDDVADGLGESYYDTCQDLIGG
jgi:hypothetical protein